MPFSAPVSLGSGATGIGSTSSVSMITTAGASVGDLVIAFAFLPDDANNFRPTVTSFSDTRGNTWTIAATHRDSRDGSRYIAVGACLSVANAILTGDTITASLSASVSSIKRIFVAKVSGVAKSALDQVVNTAEGTGNTWNAGTTGTLADPNEIVFGYEIAHGSFSSGPAGGTNTPGNGFTNTTLNTYGSNNEYTIEYKILSGSTAAQTPIGTWNPGGGGDPAYTAAMGIVVSFREVQSALPQRPRVVSQAVSRAAVI